MMSDEKSVSKERMEEVIDREVSIGVKQEIIDIYEDLFRTIWDRIMPTLGLVTTATIMERAVYLTRERFEALQYLEVTDEGLDFSELRERASGKEKGILKEGFKELVANLLDILAKLTGNVIVSQLERLVEGKLLTPDRRIGVPI